MLHLDKMLVQYPAVWGQNKMSVLQEVLETAMDRILCPHCVGIICYTYHLGGSK